MAAERTKAIVPHHGWRCRGCGIMVMPGWLYCEPCRLELAVENKHEALEELNNRFEAAEERRRR